MDFGISNLRGQVHDFVKLLKSHIHDNSPRLSLKHDRAYERRQKLIWLCRRAEYVKKLLHLQSKDVRTESGVDWDRHYVNGIICETKKSNGKILSLSIRDAEEDLEFGDFSKYDIIVQLQLYLTRLYVFEESVIELPTYLAHFDFKNSCFTCLKVLKRFNGTFLPPFICLKRHREILWKHQDC